MVDTRLRFFSDRVFGAWVEGRVVRVNSKKKTVVISAYFYGCQWEEIQSLDTEFYRPQDHINKGEPFKLI